MTNIFVAAMMIAEMSDTSNVSRRIRFVRQLLGISCRAFDRAAGRPEGNCAIIEARDSDSITRHVAQSYANAAGVSIAWLMLGDGAAPSADDVRDASMRARRFEQPVVGAHHTANDFTVAPAVSDAADDGPRVVRDEYTQVEG